MIIRTLCFPSAAYLQDATYNCERSVAPLAVSCTSALALDALNAFQTFSILQVVMYLCSLGPRPKPTPARIAIRAGSGAETSTNVVQIGR